jgi:hypothetical protein
MDVVQGKPKDNHQGYSWYSKIKRQGSAGGHCAVEAWSGFNYRVDLRGRVISHVRLNQTNPNRSLKNP